MGHVHARMLRVCVCVCLHLSLKVRAFLCILRCVRACVRVCVCGSVGLQADLIGGDIDEIDGAFERDRHGQKAVCVGCVRHTARDAALHARLQPKLEHRRRVRRRAPRGSLGPLNRRHQVLKELDRCVQKARGVLVQTVAGGLR
jgi:hypothetical protein